MDELTSTDVAKIAFTIMTAGKRDWDSLTPSEKFNWEGVVFHVWDNPGGVSDEEGRIGRFDSALAHAAWDVIVRLKAVSHNYAPVPTT